MALRLTSGPQPAPSIVTGTPKMMLLRGSCAPAQPLPRPDPQPLEPELAERVPICSLWPLGSCIEVVSARSWCSTAAPGAPGTAGALPALAQILGSAHTPVLLCCWTSCGEGSITWMSLVSLPVRAGDKPGVSVTLCPRA